MANRLEMKQLSGTLPVTKGGTGTPISFTPGSIVFAGTSGVYNQDNANLFWDDTNNRLGVGTTGPISAIQTSNSLNANSAGSTNQSLILNHNTASIGAGAGLAFGTSNTIDLIGSKITFSRTGAFTNGDLLFWTKGDGAGVPDSTAERMRIKDVGYVLMGTGTAITTDNLQVKGNIALLGSTSGSLTITSPAVSGTNTLTLPAGTTDFSTTGGASQVLKQTSAGGAFTVSQVTDADLSLSDITTNNATTSNHGFLRKLDGLTTTFLRGDGDWATPSASVTITQTEIDFGATPVSSGEFTILDAAVTPSSKIIASIAYDAPTGKDLDEVTMDDLQIRCGTPSTGSFQMFVQTADGSYLEGNFKINYTTT